MDSTIVKEEDGGSGRYVLSLPGGQEAELTFVSRGAGHMIIDYSFVPPAFRGRGVMVPLIERAVEEAWTQGTKITPTCGYVAAVFRRHPEWADVLKR
jgi:predicted GNAT family acetyltransferase